MYARLSFFVACLVFGLVTGFVPDQGTSVAFLSVGQGDCTLVKSEGWVALIDVGPRTDTFDAGKRLVVPELRRLGVRKIDCLFLTHPDMDHVGGLRSVARRFRIGQVVASLEFRDDEIFRSELSMAGIDPDDVRWVGGFSQAKLGAALLTIACPELEAKEKDNEGSLFIRVDSGGGSLMTTGDADSGTESEMQEIWDWDCDILKAGHHGSKGSMSSAWLAVTSPQIVVVSCGVRNTYGHPSKQALTRVDSYGARVLRTDKDGTIVYRATESGFVRE